MQIPSAANTQPNNGRILSREDHGLAPLEQIRKALIERNSVDKFS